MLQESRGTVPETYIIEFLLEVGFFYLILDDMIFYKIGLLNHTRTYVDILTSTSTQT